MANGNGSTWSLTSGQVIKILSVVIFTIGCFWLSTAVAKLSNVVTKQELHEAVVNQKELRELKLQALPIVPRKEIVEIVKTQSPYVPDKAKLENAIKDISEIKEDMK